ncbi:MAG: ATP-binding protein [Desulfobulbaceae bacterium]|nr:ATP-binding protein [Desulfobulbaceae bacterium]
MVRKKIMLVEDEAVTALDLESNMIKLGYEVPAVVASGEEAVRKAAELHPDLILMDIILVGPMDGIEAADEILKSNAIPIIFLTAYADAETIRRAKATEPFGYLSKPCNYATIKSTIEVALYKGEVDRERRKAEKALQEAEEKYRTVANFTHDWEFWISPDDRLLYTSPSCARITGHSAVAFEKDPSLMRRIVHPDDIAVFDQHCQGVRGAKEEGEVEFRIIHADGSIRWIAHVCQSVNNDQGQFTGTRGSNRDVTRLRKLEEELYKARNLESLGIFAGGIAHDFNNLLQRLLGNINMAKICTAESSEAYPFLQDAESAYLAAINLTKQFIAISAGNISAIDTINPTDVIRAAVSSVLLGSNIKAVYDLPENLENVDVDTGQLRQAICNITLNAREAMPSVGRLLVGAANEMLEELEVPGLAPGKYIKISIRDQGRGIAPDILPKIFDPYFSTKELGQQKGMGLGLTVSDSIIRKHDGAITVETEIGKGSTFHIHLPAAVSAVAEAASKAVKRT